MGFSIKSPMLRSSLLGLAMLLVCTVAYAQPAPGITGQAQTTTTVPIGSCVNDIVYIIQGDGPANRRGIPYCCVNRQYEVCPDNPADCFANAGDKEFTLARGVDEFGDPVCADFTTDLGATAGDLLFVNPDGTPVGVLKTSPTLSTAGVGDLTFTDSAGDTTLLIRCTATACEITGTGVNKEDLTITSGDGKIILDPSQPCSGACGPSDDDVVLITDRVIIGQAVDEDVEIRFDMATDRIFKWNNADTVFDFSETVRGLAGFKISSGAGLFDGFLTIAALTGDQTYTFPDKTGEVCVGNAASCTGAILDNATATGIFVLPFAADPTTDADGESSIDLDAWASGRDALEIYDGTASTYVVATQASDTPTDGQIIKWNSDGTITWEDEIRDKYWESFLLVADGARCADPVKVLLGSGPRIYTIICADNNSSIINGSKVMPVSWDGGTVTFELTVTSDNATPSGDYDMDFSVSCRGNDNVINSTFGTEVAADVDFDAGGSCGIGACATNALVMVTTAAATGDGPCLAGDMLFWKGSLDATGTTAVVADVHIIGVKMEF